ncbi:NAD(P)H-dependent oxidoreductase [Paraburkholderia bengalensis]|uniref:FMN dependent NADH:quinone oxidoreductase n=1 Tax=Paraburkholderia bengalensis TaxID=2747562 RepID=A0ABU8J2W3_9BURK
MSKLLYIEASPRGTLSGSTLLANTYLDELRKTNPGIEVDTLRVWEEDLPEFDTNTVAAKMSVMTGQALDATQRAAWDKVTEIANRFISADRYVIASPMWNNGIPYRLKHYIDIVHQPGLTWTLQPAKGFIGLLKNKHASLFLTAGVYGPTMPSPAFGVDHQGAYLKGWLNQAGVDAIDEVLLQPSLLTPDALAALTQAKERAVELAVRHGAL